MIERVWGGFLLYVQVFVFNFTSNFLLTSSLWVFFLFLMLSRGNFIQIVGVVTKHLGWYAKLYTCHLHLSVFFIFIPLVLGLPPHGCPWWVTRVHTYLVHILSSSRSLRIDFFRVVVNLIGQSHLYDENNGSKFTFYWTNEPFRYKEWPKDIISNLDKRILSILEDILRNFLPRIAFICLRNQLQTYLVSFKICVTWVFLG